MDRLALSGGPKAVPDHFIKPWPIITESDIERVVAALRSGKLWGRKTPNVVKLEAELCDYFGTLYCILTQSGTSALHLALTALGVGPGDEVITTSFTHIATALAVLHANAVPVFADIDPVTGNISPEDVEEKIGPATKAILPVHMHGLPADMDAINALASKYGLAVVEDACQAHGAFYRGKKVGSLADVACFSLNGSKNLNAGGEGGFLLTSDRDIYEKALSAATFGEDVANRNNHNNHNGNLGWMYRIQELPAAIARGQLQQLDARNAARIRNAHYLTEKLSGIRGIITPSVPEGLTHIYFMYRPRFDPAALGLDVPRRAFREAVEKALALEGVLVGHPDNLPLYRQPLFTERKGYGNGCPWSCNHNQGNGRPEDKGSFTEVEKLLDDYTLLRGIHPPNGRELMERYVEAFEKVFGNIEEVMERSAGVELPAYGCELVGGWF